MLLTRNEPLLAMLPSLFFYLVIVVNFQNDSYRIVRLKETIKLLSMSLLLGRPAFKPIQTDEDIHS